MQDLAFQQHMSQHSYFRAGRHEGEVQELMGDLYSVAGDTSAMMNCLVEQKEAFAREACMAALLDATGIAAI